MKGNIVIGLLVGFLVGAVLGWIGGQSKFQTADMTSPRAQIENKDSIKEVDFKMTMRKLWEDHITWTRMYIVSAIYNNGDTQNTAVRLLKNQEDIGNAIKPYYGDEAGNKLTVLLKDHINDAAALVKAAKVNNTNALNDANTKWYDNANQISDFLAGANPNWPKDAARAMMKDHLDLTKQEAMDILNKKYDQGITDYDKVHEQILTMADMLSSGIIKQYPDKF